MLDILHQVWPLETTGGPWTCTRRYEPWRVTQWCCPAPSATRSTPNIPPSRCCGAWAMVRAPPSCTAAPAGLGPPPVSRDPSRTSATGWRVTRGNTTYRCALTAPPCRTMDAITAGWRFREKNTSALRTRWELGWESRVWSHKNNHIHR